MSGFKKIPFFGGAITGEIPNVFEDASRYREVPDAQEVYVASSYATDISVIIDITQRLEATERPVPSTPETEDEAAVREHFEDTIDLNREGKVLECYKLDEAKRRVLFGERFPANTPIYTMIGTISGPLGPPNEPPNPIELNSLTPYSPFTALYMTIIRLESQKTDIVVTVNIPYFDHAQIAAETRIWHPSFGGPVPPETSGEGAEGRILVVNGGGAGQHKNLDDAVVIMDRLLGTFEVVDWDLFSPED